MKDRGSRLTSFIELRQFVYQTLCDHEDLEWGRFPTSETPLFRCGVPCGIMFCLHGPRETIFTAIWDRRGNTVFFYTAAGHRFHVARLNGRPARHCLPG